MEFEIPRDIFVEALQLTQGVVERRNTLPILANVLIEVEKDSVTVQATDGEIGIRKVCEIRAGGSGSLTVNARKLYEIARQAPGETVRLKTLDNHQVEIVSGRSRFRLNGMDPKEFPSVPGLAAGEEKGGVAIQLSPEMFDEMVGRTLFAVSTDETRYNLSGVFAEGHEGKLRMVATDGHRLAMIDRSTGGKLPKKGVILPRKGLSEAKKLVDGNGDGGPVTLKIDTSIAKVACGSAELFMRLIEGEFPDYNQVIPEAGPVAVELDRNDVLATLRRVSLLSSERSKGVRLTLREGQLEVRANNPDLGEAAEEVEAQYQGDELSIGFNARYLIDVLTVVPEGERIELRVTDDVSPGVLRVGSDEDYTYVVMPMRLEPSSQG